MQGSTAREREARRVEKNPRKRGGDRDGDKKGRGNRLGQGESAPGNNPPSGRDTRGRNRGADAAGYHTYHGRASYWRGSEVSQGGDGVGTI